MLDTKNQTEEFENDSWIEKELEEKLWELYDRIKKYNYHNSNFAKLL